jgi:hypothetical protein
LNSMLCVRCLAMGFLLSKARLDGQFQYAPLSAPRGPLQLSLGPRRDPLGAGRP